MPHHIAHPRETGVAADPDDPRRPRGGERPVPVSAAPRPESPSRNADRPRLLTEIGVIALCYLLYSLVRNAINGDQDMAVRHAEDLLRLEGTWHVDIEHGINDFVAGHTALAVAADYYYVIFHFVVTLAILVWMYRSHAARYRRSRRTLLLTNLVALLGFWLIPLAPPRMLPGFADTVVQFNTLGMYDSAPMAAMTNQFAAMPSLHTGWSVWCALTVIILAERRWVKLLAPLYPLVTIFVIIGTANHYLADVVGGVIAVGAAVAAEHGGRTVYQGVRRRRAVSV